MKLLQQVESEISRIVSELRNSQSSDGSWQMYVDAGPRIDAYMILLLRSLKIGDEKMIQQLAGHIAALQTENGAWKLYDDEEKGNLSATIECYYALLWAGSHKQTDKNMKDAKRFILSEGGLSQASQMTKIILAVTGQYPWKNLFLIPVETLLFPSYFPINLYDFSGHARVHMVPVLILSDRKFVLQTENTPNLADLWAKTKAFHSPVISNNESTQKRFIIESVEHGIKKMFLLPQQIHAAALKRAEQFMLERIEADGTLYSYASSTILMIYALMALGYPSEHPLITRAVHGLKTMHSQTGGSFLMQNFNSTVWDTAWISTVLQEAGISSQDRTVRRAGEYLHSQQHVKYGDWKIHNPYISPGGWGFSHLNSINPDIDDTTAALRALHRLSLYEPRFRESWKRGLNWLISMQNRDGGWPAFEKNTDKQVLTWLPLENMEDNIIDPSTADLTGRTLEFLGRYAGFDMKNKKIMRAVRWLTDHQEKDGSWYGRWGICYIYGTWAALTGMMAVGISPQHPSVKKAVRWLLDIQNADGGWGESCKSDILKKYVPLGASTPSQTACAVDALLSVFQRSTPKIDKGIRCLLEFGGLHDWRTSYPTGAGVSGNFYLQYHSSRYIWPLLALCRFKISAT